MTLLAALEDLPVRIATGGFILNSGLEKLSADSERAATLHGFATGTYPFLGSLPPEQFAKALAYSEVGLGAALLLPIVPSRIAGAGLAAFAGGLLGLYLRTPGMRQEGSFRPTEQGIPLAKDVWMIGAGLSLLVADRRRTRRKRKSKGRD
ncbi:MAG TPA: DoxX family membrane protein [Acidimicrobiales bacterium]|nr:DoxX family membrane protein [Acidimicrobiales bacterium]